MKVVQLLFKAYGSRIMMFNIQKAFLQCACTKSRCSETHLSMQISCANVSLHIFWYMSRKCGQVMIQNMNRIP